MVNFSCDTFVAPSSIHSMGRFTKHFISEGTTVVEINGNIHRNENQSYVNHSLQNNMDYVYPNSWCANRDIYPEEELTMNYLQWIAELPF